MNRIILAYSGGLNTSVAIPWLKDKYQADVIAVSLDLGQGRELADVRERALAIGATRAHVLDAREEFVADYIVPALQAGAVYQDRYPLATALGRPLIASHLVKVAEMEDATIIAHGCTGEANDQVRIEVSARALNPGMTVLAPAREWTFTSQEKVKYAEKFGIPVPAIVDRPYRVDVNLWGRSVDSGVLEDAWHEPPEEIYALTRASAETPDAPAYVEIEFSGGVPAMVNGVSMPLVELIGSLETIAGAHGVGRIDMVEDRLDGIKSREIYEAPAAVVLHTAHRELERIVIPRDLERLTHEIGRAYADLVYNGRWFTPTREAMDALVANVQTRVSGLVRLKLFKGQCQVVGRKSPHALYDPTSAAVPAVVGAVSETRKEKSA